MKHNVFFRMLCIGALIAGLSLALSCNSKTKTSVESLSRYTLKNGLTLFTAEDHAVPLVYIEIAVRAGGISQTAQNAGLFHLYEHMMFKGNDLYADAASVQRAISDMGTSDWNGSTGIEHVNYFFTIPSDQLETGLAFWNAAIRSPLMDERELENEKKVVLSEIEGDEADPPRVFRSKMNTVLFPERPWKLDAGGSPQVVRDATVEQLREIQHRYYIPKNAALFVGGDINSDAVYKLVDKIYGNWSNNGYDTPKNEYQPSQEPLLHNRYFVIPYDTMSPQLARIVIEQRGPDADFAVEDTYSADFLMQLLQEPNGFYKQTLFNDTQLGIPDTDYIFSGYSTVRANGRLIFGANVLSPEQNLPVRAQYLLSEIQQHLLIDLANDAQSFSEEQQKKVLTSIADTMVYNTETPQSLLSTVRYWWTSTSTPDYYDTYTERMSKVTQQSVQDFVQRYVCSRAAAVCVMVNPDVYESCRAEFDAAGFELITADDAFWWKNDFHDVPESEHVASAKVGPSASIYRTKEKKRKPQKEPVSKRGVKTKTLSNGIPVYCVKSETNHIVSVSIACRGGTARLTPETSGLESALFSFMERSSGQYPYEERQKLMFETSAEIYSGSNQAGSMLSLECIDYYLDDLLAVLLDGFLNPLFAQDVYTTLMTDYRQGLQRMLNTPESLLSHELVKTIYADHPYKTRSSVTPESIDSITIPALQELHNELLDPACLFVVAVGNFDEAELCARLDDSLGTMPLRSGTVPARQNIPPVHVSGEAVVLTHPSAAGTGFVYRVFPAPANTADDFMAANIASDVYSSILYNVVREKNGVCYSTYSYTTSSKAALGMEYLYRVSNLSGFTAALDEARNIMRQGVVIDAVNEDGSYQLVPLSERIEGYKNSYINSTYKSQQTTAAIGTLLAKNILLYDDIDHDKQQLADVKALTAEQVQAAFDTWWLSPENRWFAIVGPQDAENVKF
ncbi:MAG: insulinase family protein [Treponema sp.]|nr:insulinase family protein [Treponema sp.]